ncbi:hypothetical protein DYB25_007056 [Aphanomyces astaci]|uniref:Uncharacterized protein n=1 Tax=Aphanomyces astaci TaxID=112090 RepID=A0A397E0F8_APHAT|nr:hypothetical protein DYB25_007056 [Aphanomyces astaci]RHY68856.1 hypothetical protein DYB30_009014 [Aphanomyces astaci]RHY71576.1 hypothetical protein DYB38_005995 [Aphanomyces astaci]RHZ05480.1 hypothetical protein DYB31_008104 [Aphanomyces astaci]
MLLECCYHAIAAATKLAPTQDKKDALQAWRWASSDAGTMTEAHHIALDVHTWSTLLQSAATYSKLYKPAFHTDLTQLKNTWLAIVASLLDMGGLEETDLPDTYSLIDLIELAHTDGLLDLVDNLSWGKFCPHVDGQLERPPHTRTTRHHLPARDPRGIPGSSHLPRQSLEHMWGLTTLTTPAFPTSFWSTDHNAVCVYVAAPTHRRRNARHQLYPIRSAQPLRLQQHILHFLHAASADPVPPADICARWDDFIDSLQGLLRQLQLAETPPRQPPLPIDTPSQRLETIEAYANQLAEMNRYRHGRSMIEDDTAIFLRHLRSLPWALDLLRSFGDISGLQIQLQKSFGICLNSTHTPDSVQSIPFITVSIRRQYLGIQVGLGSLTDANWDACYRSTVTRLQTASSKTHHQPAQALVLKTIVQS